MSHRYALAAWNLITPEVQAALDASETVVAAQRLHALAATLVAETGCAPETARRHITRALAKRRGDLIRPAVENRLLTLSEASRACKIKHETLRKAVNATPPRLPAEKRGRDWWVWLEDAREFALAVTPRPRD